MLLPESAVEFRKKHFLVFVVPIFLAMCSCVCLLALSLDSYFKRMDLGTVLKISFSVMVVVNVFQSVCCVNILRGRPSWVGGMVFLFFLHLLFAAPTIVHDPHLGLHVLTLVSPLIGLYCLNTIRYRAMLQAAETVGLEKAAGSQTKLKTSRRQTAINHRLRAKSEKPYAISEVVFTIINWGGWALSLLFVIIMLVKLYVVYGGLSDGVVVGANRFGPPKSYSFVDQPWMYGLSMGLHLLTIGICALFLRVMLMLRKW